MRGGEHGGSAWSAVDGWKAHTIHANGWSAYVAWVALCVPRKTVPSLIIAVSKLTHMKMSTITIEAQRMYSVLRATNATHFNAERSTKINYLADDHRSCNRFIGLSLAGMDDLKSTIIFHLIPRN